MKGREMKKILIMASLAVFLSVSAHANDDDYTYRGYTSQDGTQVAPDYSRTQNNNPQYGNDYHTGQNYQTPTYNSYDNQRSNSSSSSSGSYKTYRDRGGNIDIQSDGSGAYIPPSY